MTRAEKLLGKLRPQAAHELERAPAKLPAPYEPDPSVMPPDAMLGLIEMMRESGKYDWADDTLRGITDTIEGMKRVTEAQRDAVYNIRHARKGDYE